MKKIIIMSLMVMLSGCASNTNKEYIHAAGFDIEKGQKVTDFFDDFEEPMHAHYIGNNTLKWTYSIDYKNDNGKIVRYCELKSVRKPLCNLNVEFHDMRVSDAYSDCK